MRFKDHYKKIAIILVAFVGVAYLASIFSFTNVDGNSMNPTLEDGQSMLVKTDNENIEYGDLVIFYNTAEKRDVVKRIIGIPGDEIEFKDNMIYRNGKAVTEFHTESAISNMEVPLEGETFKELKKGKNPEYYVLGDNLEFEESVDSRQLGAISTELIKGKVIFH